MRWLGERSHMGWGVAARRKLAEVHPVLGGLYLDEITPQIIAQIRAAKIATGVKPATVNRLLAVLRSVLNAARKEGWIDTVPAFQMMCEPKRRVRWLTHAQADQLLAQLPPHLAAMMRFTLATGLRETNVTQLQWSQVDLGQRRAWIHADQSKNRRALAVPLNQDAVEVLRSEFGKHELYVFTYQGQPVTRANNRAWRKALVRAGIEDFRWHDLRHTWASWHVQNGTPLEVLKELGGWESLEMVMRYAHLSGDHLMEHAERITRTNYGTPTKNALAKTALRR